MVMKRNREKDQEKWNIKKEDTKRRKEKEVKGTYTQL